MANVKPLGDRILAVRLDPAKEVKGGIIIPDTAKEKPLEADVVAVGAGRVGDDGKRQPVELEVGDRILISKYGGTEVKLGGVEHIILREDDVLAVVEN
jgi:chaperonin GroES